MTILKLVLISCFFYFSIAVDAQRYKEQLTFSSTGDQTMELGRYRIGTAIRIECQIDGGWAEDGGIYHIVSDWGGTPVVSLRSESSISNRLKFFGYKDPTNNGYAYLYATWWNLSPSGTWNNNVKFTIYSEVSFDTNVVGDFNSAVELETVLEVSGTTRNVGIGTTNPTEKLSVNGTIRAQEVKVEASPWPDYVFEEGYQLPTIDSLANYIQSNRHLPEVPTAEEVEENGIAVGEMNAILLKKIEELTLYLIDQNKKLEAQQEEIEVLKKLVSEK